MAQGDCNRSRSKKNKQSALAKYKSCPPQQKNFFVWLYFRVI